MEVVLLKEGSDGGEGGAADLGRVGLELEGGEGWWCGGGED